MDKEFNKGSDGGGKEVFDLHPSLATAPMDKDFNKAGGKAACRSRARTSRSATATW